MSIFLNAFSILDKSNCKMKNVKRGRPSNHIRLFSMQYRRDDGSIEVYKYEKKKFNLINIVLPENVEKTENSGDIKMSLINKLFQNEIQGCSLSRLFKTTNDNINNGKIENNNRNTSTINFPKKLKQSDFDNDIDIQIKSNFQDDFFSFDISELSSCVNAIPDSDKDFSVGIQNFQNFDLIGDDSLFDCDKVPYL